MKKILLIICVLLATFALCGCENEKEDYKNLSKVENHYFVGESENYQVTFTVGMKEEPMLIDGSAGKLHPYGKITLEVKSGFGGEYSYQLAIGEEGFAGDFQDEIVGGNKCAEIAVSDVSELEYKILIKNGEKTEEVPLSSVITEDMIKWNEAKAIATKTLAQNIANMKSEISDNYEAYVKFVWDKETKIGSWYVAFASETDLCAVLIDPKTGKVIAKR